MWTIPHGAFFKTDNFSWTKSKSSFYLFCYDSAVRENDMKLFSLVMALGVAYPLFCGTGAVDFRSDGCFFDSAVTPFDLTISK